MGAGNPFRMEPPVAAGRELKGKLVILVIIFSHIKMETRFVYIVKRTAGKLHLFAPALPADIAACNQLLLNLRQVFLVEGNVKGRLNGFQMVNLLLHLPRKLG